MKQPELYDLKGELRESGRRHLSGLRKDLKVPCVMYGPKVKENVHFTIMESDLEKILSVSQTKLQNLSIDGKEYKTLLKKVEYDPVSDRPLHADFYLLDEKTPVKLRVPVRLTGIAKGVRDAGGRVLQPLRIVNIKVLPDKIPALFLLDISNLGIGDSLTIGDLDMEGINTLDDARRTIVTIVPPKSESAFTSSALDDDDELGLEEAEEGAEGVEAAGGEAEAEADEATN
ncbi:MAG: 50S ribosomal protein L25 [Balneolaceae bacterium]|nr:MAG: 50S ribosomal protein L25 [Balneolaceae bacterium]